MRKIYLVAGMWAALFSANAQQTATFEEIDLQPDSFYNGADGAGGFTSGGVWFPTYYAAQYNYWSGFSVSNMKDTLTSGYENQYSAIAAGGIDSSENYAVVYAPENLKLTFDDPVQVKGFYITNSVYAYLAMRDGSDWTKKFGGADTADPDFFKLMVYGTDVAGNLTDTVDFFLADFRFEDPKEDYIVKKWKWLDVSVLGKVKELNFSLNSTDTGEWGMNTPAYFCIDNFTLSDVASDAPVFTAGRSKLNVFPNPVNAVFKVEVPMGAERITVLNSAGRIIYLEDSPGQGTTLISALEGKPSGLYFLQVNFKSECLSKKIIKY